jgi:hypothetical protein
MAAELVDRMAILVASRRSLGIGVSDSHTLHCGSYVSIQHFVRRTTYVPFRHILGDVRREFMQRLSTSLNGTLGSYLRGALQKGSVNSCSSDLVFSLFSFVCLVVPAAFSCDNFYNIKRHGRYG